MNIGFQFRTDFATDITDWVGIALLIVAYFYMKNRRPKLRKIEETAA